MNSFTKRERNLIGTMVVLIILVLFLLFKIVDYKIDLLVLGGDRYVDPLSMEESIEDASMIFLCKTEVTERKVKYKIDEIIFKDQKYEFPYNQGDYYPRLQDDVEVGVHYGEGQIVILSSKPPTTFQSLLIMQSNIPGYNNIKVGNFIEAVKKIKKISH